MTLRLRRSFCRLFHRQHRKPHTGFGWYGWRCSRCGWMFFVDWDDLGKAALNGFSARYVTGRIDGEIERGSKE